MLPIQAPCYLSHTNTKVSHRPIAQQTFCLNVHKNHNFKSVNVKGVPEAPLQLNEIRVDELPIDKIVNEGIKIVASPVLIVKVIRMLPDVHRQ